MGDFHGFAGSWFASVTVPLHSKLNAWTPSPYTTWSTWPLVLVGDHTSARGTNWTTSMANIESTVRSGMSRGVTKRSANCCCPSRSWWTACRFLLTSPRRAVDGGVVAFTVKEGDGAEWSTAKLGLPRHFAYWREPAVRDPLRVE